ncbi:MAG: NADH dehydrogenase [Gammaproteobacteria bacterium RIFCSPHIGHO2_12_FULL_43_28]|nr:MAG: NADH dehydrogenase [Gammaproteobacteria bacterium RIFCSPHIGHO2_12_FULL_43_28]
MMSENEITTLSQAVRDKLDQWLLRYPPDKKRSGVFEALRLVQEENQGFLTLALMDAVAAYLELPKIAVYEVATFYTMYSLDPVGKHVINLCTNISCCLNGSDKILAHLKKRLGIDVNETTKDGSFTLKEVECLGACVAAPVCNIGKQYHVNLTPEKMDEIINALSS